MITLFLRDPRTFMHGQRQPRVLLHDWHHAEKQNA
jgi:hypothetical protein